MSWEEGGGRQEDGLVSSECSGQQVGVCMFAGIPQAFPALSHAYQAGSVSLQLSQHQAPLLAGAHVQSQ